MNEDLRYCSHCGSAVSATARFCAKCGRSFDRGASGGSEAAIPLDSPQAIEWEIAFPLITNRFFLYDMAKLLFWTFLIFNGILLTIFLLQGEWNAVMPMLGISGLILLGFVILIIAITVLIFGNRFPTRFAVRPDGVFYWSLSGRASALNRAAIVAGALAGKPGAAGAGLLAASRESGGIDWKDIRRVREYPGQRALSIMNSWRVVVRLYCSPENYARVLDLVRMHAATAAAQRTELQNRL
jgi:hypothetical protein